MIKVGITGQSGFIGSHLYNTLGLHKDKFKRIPFKKEYFNDEKNLREFINSCDVIFHFAAVIKGEEKKAIKNINFDLMKKLLAAHEKSKSKPLIFFASSIQEESNTTYGLSKKELSKALENWSEKNKEHSRAFIIPNVFGPFSKPFYNSVVSTFCYQLSRNVKTQIKKDKELELIFVSKLINEMINEMNILFESKSKQSFFKRIDISHEKTIYVSDLLLKLKKFKKCYIDKNKIPNFKKTFDRDLFNTFLTYFDFNNFFPLHLKQNKDNRGSFYENIKSKNECQVSFSTTLPGKTRGNHYHTRKLERFTVIKGKAQIDFRKIGSSKKFSFFLDGDSPSFVDMPIWHTHNIKNIGNDVLYTVFWINEFFDENDPDTFFEKV